ncbi:MAG: helix-turn-helix domain-containing protein [Nanoarchaeota archaeon]|nr:helix-turn-helix domain-containing protein [Nanoarchaeota archaeon]
MDEKGVVEDIYEEMCSYENLESAFIRARRGKTLKTYVIEFEKKLKENLMQLRAELLMQKYSPQPLKTFILRDPKTRKISKSAFRDRVVHHAVCNLIEPVFDSRFIHDSFANRIGKGTFNAVKRFDEFKRKVSKNNTLRCYILKADVKGYFDNVDHKILIQILSKRIRDERAMRLITKIIANHKDGSANKGMPLGNLTSQFFANVYLNELDQYVKHKLRAKYYIRYVDDFAILHQSRKALEDYKERIDIFLKEKLCLKLHPDKSRIIKLESGIGFLGFRVFYHHKLLARKNMRKFEKNLEQMGRQYMAGKLRREKVIEKFEGWLAYAVHANTYKYRRRMTSRFNFLFPFWESIEITSVKKHENFNHKIDASRIEFTQLKTLQLIKKGMSVNQIAEARGINEGTVWAHAAKLIEHHQLQLKSILGSLKIKKILANIKSPEDKLKAIKERINDESISYDETNCVLANIRGKHKKKSANYFINWYQRTNCFRKCYFNKDRRQDCRVKFQQLAAKSARLYFTKTEFLDFFNSYVKICALPEKDKRKYVSWREFRQSIQKKVPQP